MNWPELRKKCRRESDYIITLLITNEISLVFTWILIRTQVTPNQVTLASIVCGMFCGLFYSYGNFIVGSFFLLLSHISDCTDGNLARAKETYSSFGKWLDMFGDRLVESMIFIGIGVYFIRIGESAWVMISLTSGVLLILYYYIVDIGLALSISKTIQNIGNLKFKDVHIKWGIMEPVIYGFIILASLGFVKIQLVLVLAMSAAGLVYQTIKGIKISEKLP
ncbi:CDP-alcohol phosphatidyltransferase family protein [Thermodesulfobacteriota bacterium]